MCMILQLREILLQLMYYKKERGFTMIKLTAFPAKELEKVDKFFVTIAMELHATSVSSDQDRIQLNNLLEEAKKRVEAECDKEVSNKFQEQIERAKINDVELVTYRGGLALYITEDEVYYYHLGIPVANLVNVGKAPNLTPLIENYQYTNQYHVLILNREDIRLFEGDATSVKEIDFEDDDAPRTLNDALGSELTGGGANSGAYSATGGGEQGYHGHNDTSHEKDIDRENYFREVDNYIHENYSSARDLPLILYALSENQAVFRELSKNPYLIDGRIEESGANANFNTVQEKALNKNIEIVKKEQETMFNRFRETAPKFRIDNQLDDLSMSAIEGRIEELLVNKGYSQSGTITDNGSFEESDKDFLKQLITKVATAKGKIYIVPDDDMPDGINVSARLRY